MLEHLQDFVMIDAINRAGSTAPDAIQKHCWKQILAVIGVNRTMGRH